MAIISTGKSAGGGAVAIRSLAGCTCGFNCGCTYSPFMIYLALGVGVALFLGTLYILYAEFYCPYGNMEECTTAYDSQCEVSAASSRTGTVGKTACVCRFCKKCARSKRDLTIGKTACAMAQEAEENQDNTFTLRMGDKIRKWTDDYGITRKLS